MDHNILVKLLGFPATLLHSDTAVLDRWLFLSKHLPRVPAGSKRVVEIGCGSGAFTIGAARRGYASQGLSWDTRGQKVAAERAAICKAPEARFMLFDVRCLDELVELRETCDVVICCETIEHILNDEKLMKDMAGCLKPGGCLLLTTPNFYFKSIGGDEGPFLPIEDGRHVRRGYKKEDLERLCALAKLTVTEIGYCSGFLSQKGSVILHNLSRIHPIFAWIAMIPYRLLPVLFDGFIANVSRWPGYSITLVATKP